MHHTWMIKEKNSEVVEALYIVELIQEESKKKMKVGTNPNPLTKEEIVKSLKKNLDVFTWSHEDMPGISRDIIQHHLNVSSKRKPVQQRRRVLVPKRNEAMLEVSSPKIVKKVQKLMEGIIDLNRFIFTAIDKCLPFFKTLKLAFAWMGKCEATFQGLKCCLSNPPLPSTSKEDEICSCIQLCQPQL